MTWQKEKVWKHVCEFCIKAKAEWALKKWRKDVLCHHKKDFHPYGVSHMCASEGCNRLILASLAERNETLCSRCRCPVGMDILFAAYRNVWPKDEDAHKCFVTLFRKKPGPDGDVVLNVKLPLPGCKVPEEKLDAVIHELGMSIKSHCAANKAKASCDGDNGIGTFYLNMGPRRRGIGSFKEARIHLSEKTISDEDLEACLADLDTEVVKA